MSAVRRNDPRVLAAFKDPMQVPYMQGLEQRVSALEVPDYDRGAPVPTKTIEVGNVIRVGVQLYLPNGQAVGYRTLARCWLATTQYGAPVAVDTSAAVNVGTLIKEVTTRADFEVLTNDAGFFQLALGHSVAADYWLHTSWQGRVYLWDTAIRFT